MNPQNVGAVILGAVALASSAVAASPIASTTATTTYHRTQAEGVGVFYREAGLPVRLRGADRLSHRVGPP